MLAGFIRRSGADRSGPAGHSLRSGVFKHRLIGSGDEGGSIVDCEDDDKERLRSRSITPAIGCSAVIMQRQSDNGSAVGVGRWSVAERSIQGYGGLGGKELRMIV